MMNPLTFKSLLEIYGADLDRWPAEHRRNAETLLDASPDAQRMLKDAAELDRLLLACAPEIADDRVDRLALAVIRAAERLAPPPAWTGWRWVPGGAIYAGLFILGGVGNLLTRLIGSDAPLDLLFSGNLLLPFGG